VKQGFREMQERMNQQNGDQTAPVPGNKPRQKTKSGEYIDFEEIKE
jgi:hypothetical protein